ACCGACRGPSRGQPGTPVSSPAARRGGGPPGDAAPARGPARFSAHPPAPLSARDVRHRYVGRRVHRSLPRDLRSRVPQARKDRRFSGALLRSAVRAGERRRSAPRFPDLARELDRRGAASLLAAGAPPPLSPTRREAVSPARNTVRALAAPAALSRPAGSKRLPRLPTVRTLHHRPTAALATAAARARALAPASLALRR